MGFKVDGFQGGWVSGWMGFRVDGWVLGWMGFRVDGFQGGWVSG